MNEVKNFINPNLLPNLKCSNCTDVDYFLQVYRIKPVSRLISPNGQEGIITIPVYVCPKCNTELTLTTPQK